MKDFPIVVETLDDLERILEEARNDPENWIPSGISVDTPFGQEVKVFLNRITHQVAIEYENEAGMGLKELFLENGEPVCADDPKNAQFQADRFFNPDNH